MIVCHCNVITSDRIETVVSDAMQQMPASAITAAHVYDSCQVMPDCGNCSARICQIIKNMTAQDVAAA